MDVSRTERRIRTSATAREGRPLRHWTRALAVVGVAALGIGVGSGTSGAAVDSVSSIVDASDNLVEVSLGDTSIVGVPPLDGSPLTREFFLSGYFEARMTGPTAASLEDSTITFGYQVGYPIALAAAVIELNTPGLGWEIGSNNAIVIGDLFGEGIIDLEAGNQGLLAGDIIPQQTFAIELEPGGITNIPIVEDQVFDGPGARIRVGNMQGSVAGALGQVTLRPYAKVVLATGDTVMTYGAPIPV